MSGMGILPLILRPRIGNFFEKRHNTHMNVLHHLPLSRKVILGIVPLFLVFISLSVVLQNHFQEQAMFEQAQLSAHTYADIIKEAMVSMMVNNLEVDESFLERVNTLAQFDSLHILVNNLNLREELLTPRRAARIETKHKTLRPHDDLERNALERGQAIFTRNGDQFRAVIPFTATRVCQKCHAVPVGYTLGATDLHISFARVSQAAAGNWKRSLLIFFAFTVIAMTVAVLMFRRFVSKPIEGLVEATNEINKGNLEFTIVQWDAGERGGSQDELRFLAERFDEMRQSLKEKITQLDQVNRHLSERNIELEEALVRLRRAQEVLVRTERLAVTGTMTAQLSHEINNPIHNVHSLLESSLRKMDGNAQARELIEVALEEVARMAKLTRQMLDFYRGSVVDMEKESVNMRDLLVEIVRANEQSLAQRHVDIVLEVPPALPVLQGSSDKLKQVVLNLILNARDAMPDGGRITIRALAELGNVCIDVADTGIGIPPDHLVRIFDPFFTTKKEVSGVGLGLFVTYGIVQQHKGTINVMSTVGKGTTFSIRFPTEGNDHG